MAPQTNKQLFRLTGVALVLAILVFVVPSLIYGGAPAVRLSPGPSFGGEISQAIGVQDNGKLLTANKGFTITDTRYFQNRAWVFVTIDRANVGGAFVVLHRVSGVYTVVLGPGTAFASNYLTDLPADLTQYMNSKGILYDALQ